MIMPGLTNKTVRVASRFYKPGEDWWAPLLSTCKTNEKFKRVDGHLNNQPNLSFTQCVVCRWEGSVKLFTSSSCLVLKVLVALSCCYKWLCFREPFVGSDIHPHDRCLLLYEWGNKIQLFTVFYCVHNHK